MEFKQHVCSYFGISDLYKNYDFFDENGEIIEGSVIKQIHMFTDELSLKELKPDIKENIKPFELDIPGKMKEFNPEKSRDFVLYVGRKCFFRNMYSYQQF